MANVAKYMSLPRTPHWNVGRGLWYPSSSVPSDKPTPLVRWRPTIDAVCERLLGSSTYFEDESGARRGCVRYLSLETGTLLYREALELIIVFRQRSDLFSLATYRRQLTTEGDIDLDGLFLELAEECVPALSCEEWDMLAERMPKNSKILAICQERAHEPLGAEERAAE